MELAREWTMAYIAKKIEGFGNGAWLMPDHGDVRSRVRCYRDLKRLSRNKRYGRECVSEGSVNCFSKKKYDVVRLGGWFGKKGVVDENFCLRFQDPFRWNTVINEVQYRGGRACNVYTSFDFRFAMFEDVVNHHQTSSFFCFAALQLSADGCVCSEVVSMEL